MNILDFLFPKYCVNCNKLGDFLCSDCFSLLSFDTKNICLVCTKPSFNGLTHPKCQGKYKINGSFTGIVYNSVSKKLIYKFKYKPYLSSLDTFLSDLFYESIIQNEQFNKVVNNWQENIYLVPIPLSKSKMRSRGYNQAEKLGESLGEKLNLPFTDALARVKDTKSQVGLNKFERQINVSRAFEINKKHSANFKNKCVILVDDVLTTGSTFSEAANVLKHHGAREVWAVALAKED
jgi:competence protein ComFC